MRFKKNIFRLVFFLMCGLLHAEDWPMFGRDQTRNPVCPETNAPVEWDLKTGRNIKWRARLGTISACQPIVSGGLIWIGTNNDPPWDSSQKSPAGVLACFRERDGTFVHHQLFHSTNYPISRRGEFGLSASPYAEGNRLWMVSQNAEILCFDTAVLRRGGGPPQTLWRVDMVSELGINPAVDIMGGRGVCSLGAILGDLLYVITGNGVNWTQIQVPAPEAPALICINKMTGKMVWKDNSPGTNILMGEFASPLVMESGGIAQVIAPQGDGWVRSFEARTGQLLWKFDINPKATSRKFDRNFFLNSPVLADGRIFLAGGKDVNGGEGAGRLVYLDPKRRGDISLELPDGPNQGRPNPNSGALWHFDKFHRTQSNVAVKDGLVIAVDFSGFVYCLDAATGNPLWQHDMKANVVGSPLVVDGKIYVANEDGDVYVLELGREKKLLFTGNFLASIGSSPIFANGVLYVSTGSELFAIQQGARSVPGPAPNRP